VFFYSSSTYNSFSRWFGQPTVALISCHNLHALRPKPKCLLTIIFFLSLSLSFPDDHPTPPEVLVLAVQLFSDHWWCSSYSIINRDIIFIKLLPVIVSVGLDPSSDKSSVPTICFGVSSIKLILLASKVMLWLWQFASNSILGWA